MKQTGHTDLRVQKTRAAIKGAFREMVCQMDADDITVKELAERAHIHRKTFYLHYSSIEALFEDTLQDLADSYYEEVDKIDPPMPTDQINRVFFEHLAKQDTFYEKVICTPSYRDFSARLFSTTLQHNRNRYNPYAHLSSDEQNIVNTFLVSSTLDMYRQWVRDGKRIPLNRLIQLSGMLLTEGAQSVREDE